MRNVRNQEIAARIAEQLDRVSGLRSSAQADPKAAAARQRLRAWQSQRLARTHADLLANPQFAEAATFFLTDVYGANDPSTRDAEIQRVVPTAIKLLPAAGLETVAEAIELDALSEDLDAAMVAALGRRVSGTRRRRLWPRLSQGRPPQDRERQINLIQHIGQSLDRLARQRFISTTLAVMRKPAPLAGLTSCRVSSNAALRRSEKWAARRNS